MIAAGLFFMATFAILLLVSATLRNVRALQHCDVDIYGRAAIALAFEDAPVAISRTLDVDVLSA